MLTSGSYTRFDNISTRLAYCRQQGLDVHAPEDFLLRNKGATFDLIICESVIEHVTNLEAFASFLRSVSKEGSILFVNGLTPKLIRLEKRRGTFVKAHFLEHINYFPLPALDRLMDKAGFERRRKSVILVNSRAVQVPERLVRILKRDNGFFEHTYVKRKERS